MKKDREDKLDDSTDKIENADLEMWLNIMCKPFTRDKEKDEYTDTDSEILKDKTT
jgi:hypothetical protein